MAQAAVPHQPPESPWGYRPNQSINVIFLVSFFTSIVGLQVISLYTRQWLKFSIPLSVACLFELVGYAARAGSSTSPLDVRLFAVTTFFLTIAPSFISTSIYVTAERTFYVFGKEHSLIDPKWYASFVCIDAISLVLQVVGLVVAYWDIAAMNRVGLDSNNGGGVIAAGLVIQAIMLMIFLLLFSYAMAQGFVAWREFGYTTFNPRRGGYRRLGWPCILFLVVVVFSVCSLLARNIYRTVGFVRSFDGGNNSEAAFALCDGLLVSLAVLGLLVLHPSYVFSDYSKEKDADKLSSSASSGPSFGRIMQQGVV
ncbi:hypothetical protein JX265_008972 [Neoarthrinium moseri]|uniref:Sphingoid long-chain base transporter RSB1 n=1 Tax=Neoarthrinium moseri TaxID=1658444 RepID=A0A9Q0ALZ8_9PEZI|nr:uncharacterized protein JN550_007842 [Neoarthrinium moseri]KAI1846724.1 hypothetical protein JX266_007297 [Neoarthrinium moseri]KAI1862926.1 hypothetical protein JX265_008972 [Neoarthrinium moseri]KAI1866153.1 hypothetical protein JN550_007842 [Neoarthrinium moseri]